MNDVQTIAPLLTPARIARFHAAYEVMESECHEWRSRRNQKQYGLYRIRVGKRERIQCPAHRLAFWLARGPFDTDLFVLHSCDNPSCVNPDHLFLGTHQDNMDDAIAKGRLAWQRDVRCPCCSHEFQVPGNRVPLS